MIFLLPNVGKQPSTGDLFEQVFALGDDMPDAWMPNLSDKRETEEAFAFPTALARSELMKMVLDPRNNLQGHANYRLYEVLVLGVTLGYLDVEIIDLLSDEADDFGQVLQATEKRCQYFGLLRTSSKCGDIAGIVAGGTSPDSLFWPSPRGTNALDKLRGLINKDTNLLNARDLLADLRSLLRERELWNSDKVPWMSGFDRIIGDRPPLEVRRRYHYHSRGVGPVLAAFPDGKERPLYLPAYHDEFAATFLRTLTGTFKREGEVIGVFSQQRKSAEILMPEVNTKTGDVILAGGGTVSSLRPLADYAQPAIGKIRLRKENGEEGLFDLLQNLFTELGRDHDLYDAQGNSVERIKERPFFYPDVFRVVVARLGEAADPNADASYSEHAYLLAFEPESPGLPLASELFDLTAGLSVPFKDASGQNRRAIYIDAYRGTEINDLRALGYALWMHFDHKAIFKDNQIKLESLTPLLKVDSEGRPLAPTEEAYKHVASPDVVITYRRLASIQRFMRAYESRNREHGGNELQELCYRAAEVFIKWVWAGSEVIPNGKLTQKWQALEVAGANVSFGIDDVIQGGINGL